MFVPMPQNPNIPHDEIARQLSRGQDAVLVNIAPPDNHPFEKQQAVIVGVENDRLWVYLPPGGRREDSKPIKDGTVSADQTGKWWSELSEKPLDRQLVEVPPRGENQPHGRLVSIPLTTDRDGVNTNDMALTDHYLFDGQGRLKQIQSRQGWQAQIGLSDTGTPAVMLRETNFGLTKTFDPENIADPGSTDLRYGNVAHTMARSARRIEGFPDWDAEVVPQLWALTTVQAARVASAGFPSGRWKRLPPDIAQWRRTERLGTAAWESVDSVGFEVSTGARDARSQPIPHGTAQAPPETAFARPHIRIDPAKLRAEFANREGVVPERGEETLGLIHAELSKTRWLIAGYPGEPPAQWPPAPQLQGRTTAAAAESRLRNGATPRPRGTKMDQ